MTFFPKSVAKSSQLSPAGWLQYNSYILPCPSWNMDQTKIKSFFSQTCIMAMFFNGVDLC